MFRFAKERGRKGAGGMILGKRLFTCQPTPLLSTDGGKGVALAYLVIAIKPPVD